MMSEIKKYEVNEKITSKKLMPPLLVVFLFVFIICYVFLARALAIPMRKENSITVLSTGIITIDEVEKVTENESVTQLSAVFKVIGSQDDDTYHESIYNILSEELNNHIKDLSDDETRLVHSKIIDLQEIIRQEKSNKFRNMSLEGRKLIIHIAKEIFELYGFHLTVNLDGDIEKILDSSGSLIYSKSHLNKSEIQFKGLALILLLVLLALLICILFAKKNHLFKKDVRYDGLDKKRYA